jgi:hypothetical protein
LLYLKLGTYQKGANQKSWKSKMIFPSGIRA